MRRHREEQAKIKQHELEGKNPKPPEMQRSDRRVSQTLFDPSKEK